jgi:hypothetical protein
MIEYILIYKCRNCGVERAMRLGSPAGGPHENLTRYSNVEEHYHITHRCSDIRVGLADLIAIEEVQ